MNMMFRAFSKKLFGAGYERLVRTPLVCLILFWGLYLSEIKVQIAPFVLYFMTSTFTAGVMWQALVSEYAYASLSAAEAHLCLCGCFRRLYVFHKNSGSFSSGICRIGMGVVRDSRKRVLRNERSLDDGGGFFYKEIPVCGYLLGWRVGCWDAAVVGYAVVSADDSR